jgi:CheY-like chemotaxis protein
MTSVAAPSHRILLIEDDPGIRREIVDLLVEEGYDVQTAHNGEEALAKLQSSPSPCVILLDLMMPVMDGWAFRAEQLKQGPLANIPVVLISGTGSVASEAARLGAAGYLTKPFSAETLLGAVQGWCR